MSTHITVNVSPKLGSWIAETSARVGSDEHERSAHTGGSSGELVLPPAAFEGYRMPSFGIYFSAFWSLNLWGGFWRWNGEMLRDGKNREAYALGHLVFAGAVKRSEIRSGP